MKHKKMDSMTTGLIAGILLPAICLLVVLLARKGDSSPGRYLNEVVAAGIMPKLFSMCLIPNLLLFFSFVWTERLKSARGVVVSMFVAGVAIIIMKII